MSVGNEDLSKARQELGIEISEVDTCGTGRGKERE